MKHLIADCGISAETQEENSFSKTLADIKDSAGYTISEMAAICRKPQRTMEYWMAGGNPVPAIQRQAIADLKCPHLPPSSRAQKEAASIHHLVWDGGKGWEVRVTIDLSPKRANKVHRQCLRTRDIKEAVKRRDIVVSTLQKLGLKLVMQKRAKVQKRDQSPASTGPRARE